MDILLLVICAVTSGADGWEAIEEFGQAKLLWLRQFAPFANGIPSHDCIASVISRLSVKGFQTCFANWTEAITQATGGEVIAVDGKTASGSRDRRRGRHALHMVSAWAERRCVSGDTETVAQRFFITAIAADASRFAHAVRGHWGVENRLHWRLDVVFHEDASRIRRGNAPAIMTAIRHLCLNLFEHEPSSRRLAQKQRQAAWDDHYRAKVVFG